MEERISVVRETARKFWITSIKELQSRFKFEDPLFKVIEMLEPAKARRKKPESLAELFLRFPSLKTVCSARAADMEWRDQSTLRPAVFNCENATEVENLSVETYWKIIMNLVVPNTSPEVKRFPNLSKCVALLFCLPASNAVCERAFSALKLIKTNRRNRLHNDSVSSLMRIKGFLKNQGKTAANVEFHKDLIDFALTIKSNAAIGDGDEKEKQKQKQPSVIQNASVTVYDSDVPVTSK